VNGAYEVWHELRRIRRAPSGDGIPTPGGAEAADRWVNLVVAHRDIEEIVGIALAVLADLVERRIDVTDGAAIDL
jgi:hypothetical protein